MSSKNIISYQVDNMAYKELNTIQNNKKYIKNINNKENKEDKEDIENDCIICFAPLNNYKKNLIMFSCGHTYHYDCFINWRKQSDNVMDQCISCDTVRSYTVMPKKYKKKNIKHETICFPCVIQ